MSQTASPSTPLAARPMIARGRTAEVLSWQAGQVLKLFYDWMPACDIEREAQCARLVSATSVPSPKLLGEHMLEGRRGLIYERVNGPSLLAMLAARPWNCVQYARQFAGLQAAIHQVREAGLPPARAGFEAALCRINDLPAGLLEQARARLNRLPDGDTLLHLDFHPDQVLLTPAGPQVIDWMNAASGPPAADVARTTLLLCYGNPTGAGWFMRQLTNLLRGIFYRAYLKQYLALNPSVTQAEVHEWLPLACLARLNEGIPGDRERLAPCIHAAFGA